MLSRLMPYSFFNCLLLLIFLSSCASSNLGEKVKTGHPSVCKFDSFPAECKHSTKHFLISYTISKTENSGEYKVEGTASQPEGEDNKYIAYSDAGFILYLVDGTSVVETVTIAGGSGAYGTEIPLSRVFRPNHPFQATLMNYTVKIKD